MTRWRSWAAVDFVSLCLVLAGCDAGARVAPPAGPLAVTSAWARSADSNATGGAYAAFTNTDTAAVAIAAISSPVARLVQLHETMTQDGMLHMIARPAVVIPPESTLTLKPGGLHIMMMDLTRALRVGDTVHLTITLADGRSVAVAMPVREP